MTTCKAGIIIIPIIQMRKLRRNQELTLPNGKWTTLWLGVEDRLQFKSINLKSMFEPSL